MPKMDWKYMFSRRRWRLENYLSDCVTLEDALNKFDRAGLTTPDEETLLSYGLKTEDATTQKAPSTSKSAAPKPKAKSSAKKKTEPKAKEEYDELVVLQTDE